MKKKIYINYAMLGLMLFTPKFAFSALCNECRISEIAGSPFSQNVSNPSSLAFSPAIAGRPLCLSVTNFSSGTVSTFTVDPVTCALTPVGAPVSTGGDNPMAIAYSPTGHCVAVSNFGNPGDPTNNGSVAIFSVDPATCQLTLTSLIVTAFNPLILSFSPDGTCLVVPNESPGNPANKSLSVFSIDPATCTASTQTLVPTTNNPIAVGFSPDGNCLAVASADISGGSGTFAGFLDIYSVNKTNCALTHIIGPVSSGGMLASSSGFLATSVAYSKNNCLAVANISSDLNMTSPGNINIFSVNPSNCGIKQVGSPIVIDSANPISAAYSPDGNCLVSSNMISNNISVFNVNIDCTLTQLGSLLPVGAFPRTVAYSPDGQCIAVANSNFNPFTQATIGTGSISVFRTSFAATPPNTPQSLLSKAIQAKYCPNCRIR